LSGVTRDPAGRLPLYNVVVYVPSEPLAPLERGAACETCDGNFSGRPIAATVSDAAGNFTLDISNVPQRENIPIVVQAGKWRRQVTLASATDCGNTSLGADLSRLPKSRAEGELPHIAVMRAGSDALECLFTKIGVDLSEFTPGGDPGSVELYYSDLANATDARPADDGDESVITYQLEQACRFRVAAKVQRSVFLLECIEAAIRTGGGARQRAGRIGLRI
jgi:hypothetical protein